MVEGSELRADQRAPRPGVAGTVPLGTALDSRLLRSNEKQFRGGLVFKARRLFVSLNSRPRVIKKKKKPKVDLRARPLQGRVQGL